MPNFPPRSANWTRRESLAGIAGLATIAALPAAGHASGIGSLHEEVATRVKEITAGKGSMLRLLLPNGSGDNLKPIIAAFQSATGVKVTAIEAEVDDINTELSLDALRGSGNYDVALPATFGLPDLVDSGAILPLTKYAQRYEPKGFRDGILFGVGDSFDGETYGFQADGDTYLMFYNKAMLEDDDEKSRYEDTFGVSLSIPDTWQELDRQMGYFNRPDQDRWGGLLFRSPGYLAWEWWVRFHAKGFWPLSATMEPQIASDAGIEALEELIRAGENLHPDAYRLGLFDNWERYSKGDIYCNIGWGGSQKYFNGPKSKVRNRLAYGPTPGGMVRGQLLTVPYFNWGWNYVVTTSGSDPELGYLFALYASSPEMSTIAVRQSGGYFDPIRPEHYEDAGIVEAYSRDFLDVHRASLKNSIPDLYLKDQGEYLRTLGTGLNDAVAGRLDPKLALERVAQRWSLITSRAGKNQQRHRWAQLREKYPDHIQNSLSDIV